MNQLQFQPDSSIIIHCSALSDHSSQSAKPEQYFPNTLGAKPVLATQNRGTVQPKQHQNRQQHNQKH
jgi:hypothetical protein